MSKVNIFSRYIWTSDILPRLSSVLEMIVNRELDASPVQLWALQRKILYEI